MGEVTELEKKVMHSVEPQTSACEGILIVEDDPDIRETIRDLLADEGFTVRTAENGKHGLEVLSQGERPCLVLLDMMMPVMDGAGFLEKLREDRVIPELPVVIVSAVMNHQAPGTAGFLRKPVDLDKLLNTVKQFCQAA